LAVPVTEIIAQAPSVRRLPMAHKYPAILVPSLVLAVIAGLCFLLPLFGAVSDPNAGVLTETLLPPFSPGHLLGTDNLGNDILSRCLYGGQISIEVGISAALLGLAVGGTTGLLAGYIGGWTETTIMRGLDILLAFPAIILALAISAYLGPSEQNVILAIAFFTVPAYGRLARAATLQVRELGFVASSRMIGQPGIRILIRHVVPNVLPGLLTFGLVVVAVAMVVEATLDFLGLGVRPPEPTWGNMIASGQDYLSSSPWVVVIPMIFLFVTVLCLNILGDALRSLGNRRES
jgi:peptide/nickel transport system permease protein